MESTIGKVWELWFLIWNTFSEVADFLINNGVSFTMNGQTYNYTYISLMIGSGIFVYIVYTAIKYLVP